MILSRPGLWCEQKQSSRNWCLHTGEYEGRVVGLNLTLLSLRIRMKAEMETRDADDLQAVEALPSATGDQFGSEGTLTPGNGETSSGSEDSSATVQASASGLKSTASKQPSKPKEAKKPEGSLVGKINNLVTVDLDNIGACLIYFVFEAAGGLTRGHQWKAEIF